MEPEVARQLADHLAQLTTGVVCIGTGDIIGKDARDIAAGAGNVLCEIIRDLNAVASGDESALGRLMVEHKRKPA